MGSFAARKSSVAKLPIPPGLSGSTVKLTVLEDEFRVTALVEWPHANSRQGAVIRVKALLPFVP